MSDLEVRRLEITDGFVMRGFKGRYFMWPEEYWLLSKYLDMTRGDYLEIGSMCGIIVMSFAERYPDRQFVCVDKFCDGHATIGGERETFLQNLNDHKLKNVTLLEGDSLEIVPKISQKFEIVFVDANHAYDYVLGDANNAWRLVLPGGFIAFHDYGYVDETTLAVTEFLRRTGERFVESASSLAIVQKQAAPLRAGLHDYMRSQHQQMITELRDEYASVGREKANLQAEKANLQAEKANLQAEKAKLQTDIDWLLSSIKTHEDRFAELAAEKQYLETVLTQIHGSVSWHLVNKWRKLRNSLAPETSWHRKLYDSLLRSVNGGK